MGIRNLRQRIVSCLFVSTFLVLGNSRQAEGETINFDDLSPVNTSLTGQYPSGVIDWGSGVWFLSGPFGQFTTNSISFPSSGIFSGTFTLLQANAYLTQLDAYNGGTVSSTVTIACSGHPTASEVVNINTIATIQTG